MRLKTVKIGRFLAPNNIFLAPLAGYTNAPFRDMCRRFGAGLTFTEMVSARGLVYGNAKTEDLLFVPDDYSGIKACQIFGNDPQIMRRACESEALAPFDIIDINMGCPVPKIFNNGEGSALLKNFDLAGKIISECKKSGKVVTVKFRIGIDGNNIVAADFARVCEDGGADMITIHGRTRDKMYSGEVNFGAIAQAKNAVKIPVIANGGVFCNADAEKLLKETGADGVAVARGAMYNPRIFCEITGKEAPDFNAEVMRQLDETLKFYGERFTCVFMRKMVGFYLKGTRGATNYRERLFKCATTEEVKKIIEELEF